MYIYHIVQSNKIYVNADNTYLINVDVEIYNEQGQVHARKSFGYPIDTTIAQIKEDLYQVCSALEKDDIIKEKTQAIEDADKTIAELNKPQ